MSDTFDHELDAYDSWEDNQEIITLSFNRIKAETEKAWLIYFNKHHEYWVPKSQCGLTLEDHELIVPMWLLDKWNEGKKNELVCIEDGGPKYEDR